MKKFKYLDSFNIFERLIYSSDLQTIINDLKNTDKVAKLFALLLIEPNIYPTDSNINYLDLSNELNKLSFLPINRRKSHGLRFDRSSMPTRIGRIVNKIYDSIKSNLNKQFQTECVFISGSDKLVSGAASYDEVIELYLPSENENELLFFQLDPLTDSAPAKMRIDIISIWNNENSAWEDFKGSFDAELYYKNSALHFRFPWYAQRSDIDKKNIIGFIPSSFNKSYLSKPRYGKMKNFKVNLSFESNININDSDVANFVDKLVANIRMMSSSPDAKIKVVNGEEIRFWYHEDNYKYKKGELGSSCMRSARCQSYFDLYCKNKDQVSLAILLSDDQKLMARALLWKLPNGQFYLDRVYSILHSDVYIMLNWAKENGYFYYDKGSISFADKMIANEVERNLYVSLDECDFLKYPYLDTFTLLDTSNCRLYCDTYSIEDYRYVKELCSTDGSFVRYS